MRNFFKPNNSDGGQNPSRRNSTQTNLSENIATIRRTGVNTMTARKSIYTIIAAISVALFATVALISIGNIGAQTGPVAAAELTDIAGPECGGAGQAACTEGSIYLVSKRNGLTTSSAADGIRFDYVSAVGVTTTITSLDYVGNGESLYATYRDENEGETGEARYQNAILANSDIVTVVVEDKDAVVSGPVEHVPTGAGQVITTAGSYNIIVDAIVRCRINCPYWVTLHSFMTSTATAKLMMAKK